QPERMDSYAGASGPIATMARQVGLRSSVGAPIVVDGRRWGVTIVSSKDERTLPADTEARSAAFTELVATAISNTEAREELAASREELAASRARIVAATDEERRRVVRDLHDGAQQRLVHTIITLKLACRAFENEQEHASALLAEALDHAEQATAELRELAHGILPAVLTHGGLRAGIDALVAEALDHAEAATSELRELSHGIMPSVLTRGGLRSGVGALASRTPVPVELDVTEERLAGTVEATAYFVVAEALTNVAKHAHASRVAVTAAVEDGELRIAIRDDGAGGARAEGPGLIGLADRLAVLDGRLRVASPPGEGTEITATIPVGREPLGRAPSPGAAGATP
ncbi:MAG TPA: histidine kinase, partial [Baekduia sp.]|nr:histidine kinase [Baekduia sp.]